MRKIVTKVKRDRKLKEIKFHENILTLKISDITSARGKKRDKEGWSMDEIKEKAKNELEEFEKISKEEPDDLVSGDMDKIIRGEDDDD